MRFHGEIVLEFGAAVATVTATAAAADFGVGLGRPCVQPVGLKPRVKVAEMAKAE